MCVERPGFARAEAGLASRMGVWVCLCQALPSSPTLEGRNGRMWDEVVVVVVVVCGVWWWWW